MKLDESSLDFINGGQIANKLLYDDRSYMHSMGYYFKN